jgi:hypothetical protein
MACNLNRSNGIIAEAYLAGSNLHSNTLIHSLTILLQFIMLPYLK